MKVKPDKCRLVLSDSNVKTINVGKSIIKSTKKEKRLGFFTFENKINFIYWNQFHIENIWFEASWKLHALPRIAPYMDPQKNNLVNTFSNSQFNYCPLVWIYHSSALDNKTSKLHERCYRLIYRKNLTFQQLLEKDGFIAICIKNM